MSQPDPSEGARTYRASSGPVALVVGSLLALFLLGDAVLRAGWGQMLLLAPWVLLVLWVVYVNSFASAVRVDDHGVVVQNLLRRIEFGWAHVRDVEMRWQLVFSLDDGTDVACYGGPAKAGSFRLPARGDQEERVPAGLRALAEIEERRDQASPAAEAPIRRSWDGPAVVALIVLVLWALAAILVVNLG
ncbi:PH domain-containing protein [Microbacterium sp. BLY]|uniref:PH domain-containing protein n=1 Tax=Microbacterium sp. BLY TaxID=2823280 RepID=UPI001B32F0F4|nr:PH domain-containing protein [Microbacterium sp. BLY]MBP3977896.1 PH domain-containing protein [Microbacterium sp. BLY]